MHNSIFDKIALNDYDQFIENIKNRRNSIYHTNKDIIKRINQSIDFKNISWKDIKDGRTCIHYDGVQIETFLKISGKKRLLVTFDGSRSVPYNGEWIPKFVRWSYNNIFDGSILCFEDPMYYKFPDLSLGWYYGEKNRSYLSMIKDIILYISNILKIDNKNIILFSSSGGGYASIYTASIINGSTGIALNPQLILSNHPQHYEFTQITGIDLTIQDDLHRNDLSDAVRHGKDSKYIIIVNASSQHDMTSHFIPFCNNLGLHPNYGVSCNNNITTWIYDAHVLPPSTNHNAFEDRLLFLTIMNLASDHRYDESVFFILSEMWHERYTLLNKCNIEISSSIYDMAIQYEDKLNENDVFDSMHNAIKRNPENYRALTKIFNILKYKDMDKLYDILKWHTSKCFSIDEGFRLMATLLCMKKKFSEGIYYANRAIKINGNRIRNYMLLAQCYFYLNDTDKENKYKAINILLDGVKICPNKDDAYRLLVLFYLQLENFEDAYKSMIKIIKYNKNEININFCRNILEKYNYTNEQKKVLEKQMMASTD